ncbi:MAG TPA: hypothetical protein VGP68_14510, partial [Gemmataceae bacterium]|nr:hypothetical protein [Gemmataceae bacterium]
MPAGPILMPDFSTKVNLPALKSGNASSVFGRDLQDGDFFYVPAGETVVWDLTTSPNLAGGLVLGTLDCGSAPGAKVMNLATLAIGSKGQFLCGSCMNNVPLNGTFTLTFLDQFPDPTFDPAQFGTGFLTNGAMVDMCGSAAKTAWTWTVACHKGDSTITLLSVPNDWKVGDQLVVPGVFFSPVQDEVVTIDAINGADVSLTTAFQYDHLPVPGPNGQVNNLPIGNLSRRIVFQSANPSGTRGHVMFMRDMMGMPSVVNACHFLAKDLGRTSALIPVTDPAYDANGVPIPSTLSNNRARYSWHFHLNGQAANALSTCDAGVVWGFLKIGINNHGSYVDFTRMISYNGQGSCLFTERGTELGSYVGCWGHRTSGSNKPDGGNNQDFGNSGNGMWLQGPGVTVSGCVFSGHPQVGLHPDCQGGPKTGGQGVIAYAFPAANLPASMPLASGFVGDPPINQVPFFGISNNTAFGCIEAGFFIDSTNPILTSASPFKNPIPSVISGCNTWNCQVTGVWINNSTNVEVDSPTCVGVGVGQGVYFGSGLSCTVKNPQVSNYSVGVLVNQFSQVTDGYYHNLNDINAAVLTFGFQSKAIVSGNPVFDHSPLPAWLLNMYAPGTPQYDIWFSPTLPRPTGNVSSINVNLWFAPFSLLLPNGLQAYLPEQQPGYVPIQASDPLVALYPPFLVGLTNAQLKATYGISVGDAVAPAPVVGPTTNGTIGMAQTPRPWYRLNQYQVTSSVYTLVATNIVDGTVYQDPAPITLQAGFNALTRTIDGQTYTWFVENIGSPPPPPPPPTATTTAVQAVEIPRSLQCMVTVTAANGVTVTGGTVIFSCATITVQAPVVNGMASAMLVGVPTGVDMVQGNYSGATGLQA